MRQPDFADREPQTFRLGHELTQQPPSFSDNPPGQTKSRRSATFPPQSLQTTALVGHPDVPFLGNLLGQTKKSAGSKLANLVRLTADEAERMGANVA